MAKRADYKLLAIILIIVGIIVLILVLKNHGNGLSRETIECIANKSVLYESRLCSHCAEQLKILGDYSGLFNTIDCISEPDKCSQAGIQAVPTWVISNKSYLGVKQLKELKELAGC